MPDPKRVARIYLNQGTVDLLESDEAWRVCHETHTIPFEPAVPRCGTCRRFLRVDKEYCDGPHGNKVPLDGSGYCHEHTEAKGASMTDQRRPMKRRLTEYQTDKLELQKALDGLSALHRYAALPNGVLDRLLRLTTREARDHGLSVAGTPVPFKWKAVRHD